MPLPNLPIPTYPNVPKAPGVPPLQRAGQIQSSVAFVASGIANLLRRFLGPEWGIFDEDGAPLLIGDSVVGFDFKREARMSDYPTEKGGFASYNKVQVPYDARMSFTIGTSDAARADFLNACDKLVKGQTMVSAVTPEMVYETAQVVHYDLRRTSRAGVTLIQVDVWLMEARLVATVAFAAGTQTQTQAPSGADPVSTGTVQPTAPTAEQAAAPVQGGLF